MQRIGKEAYYLSIAAQVARRSTCLRRQYGAVIVNHDEIVATGYNGAPRGEPNCCDVGECYREAHGIPHGEQYEKCVAVHAECNAIISASRKGDARRHAVPGRVRGRQAARGPAAVPHLQPADQKRRHRARDQRARRGAALTHRARGAGGKEPA